MMRFPNKLVDFLASFGFACVLLFFLLLLTFFGTLQQVDFGIFDVQKKYFESLFLVDHTLGFPLPLPGAHLLMILLAVNLILGGILRVHLTWRRAGVLIAHLGIIFLLAGTVVKFMFATEGYVRLYENQQGSEYQSYHDWELAIYEVDPGGRPDREYLVPARDFSGLEGGERVTFYRDDLPFDLTVHDLVVNARAARVSGDDRPVGPVIDGVYLRSLRPASDSDDNIPGLYITVTDRKSGKATEEVLWAMEDYPATARAGDKTWAFDLRRRRWPLPFTVRLDKFTHEIHPRSSGKPKVFASDVTVMEGGTTRQVNISMNEPLRYRGYTLFQSSYGPQDPRSRAPVYSVFAVVTDPARDIPLAACIVISIGLLFHFTLRLSHYVKTESQRRP